MTDDEVFTAWDEWDRLGRRRHTATPPREPICTRRRIRRRRCMLPALRMPVSTAVERLIARAERRA